MNDAPEGNRTERRSTARFRLTLPRRTPTIAFDAPELADTRIQFYGFPGGRDSYANVSRAVARALVDAFDAVSVCDYAGGNLSDPPLRSREGLNRQADVGVFLGFPVHAPEWLFDHRITIGLFVCETDRILPEWVRACNRFDLVGVPSTFCRRAFIDSGVTAPIMVVPHGISPAFAPRPGLRERDRFVFFNTFRHLVADRKGYAELLRAFASAFADRNDVVLRLAVDDHRWLPPPDPAIASRVEFIETGGLDDETVARRYAAAHCVVHPSRGEGFGLVPLEALACGTPVIAPAHTGMADYLDEGNAIVLAPGKPIRAPRTDHFCGNMIGIDEADLAERLRRVATQWDAERVRAEAASESIRLHYSWEHALAPLVERVRAALDCGDRRSFSAAMDDLVDDAAIRTAYETAGRRAASGVSDVADDDVEQTRFSSIVYCGWDNPRDSIGRHLRLLDTLVFSTPSIRYKSLDELPSAYDPETLQPVAPFAHTQRPDLFRGCLYLDVVGLHPDQAAIDRQLERIADARRRLNARVAIYLMWESDRLWAPMWPLLAAADLVIVTTELLRVELERHGIAFAVLPHPYEYVVERPKRRRAGEPLVIGSSAGFWRRKNLDVLAETFADVLGNDATVKLKLHCRYPPGDADQQRVHNAIREAMSRCDNIELLVERLDREAYLDWMRSVDLYCYLSSGEGWSVTPREALHLGKPVMLLDAHAHAGFSHLPGVIRVEPGPGREARHGLASIDGDVGWEAEVSRGTVADLLSDVDSHYANARLALIERFDEILAHHESTRVRSQWLRALNEHFP